MMYLLWQAKAKHADKQVAEHRTEAEVDGAVEAAQMRAEVSPEADVLRHRQVVLRPPVPPHVKALGGIGHDLTDMQELAELAQPFYNRFARGGEGHLEVGKNVYYTVTSRRTWCSALKPFGCMPSSQSDGVQSAVMNHFKDMIFLPIETSGEGEVNAHSRVQMALGEAKAKAKLEFEQVLEVDRPDGWKTSARISTSIPS